MQASSTRLRTDPLGAWCCHCGSVSESYTCHAPASHFVHARRRSGWLSGHLWILQVLAVMPATTIRDIYKKVHGETLNNSECFSCFIK